MIPWPMPPPSGPPDTNAWATPGRRASALFDDSIDKALVNDEAVLLAARNVIAGGRNGG